MTTTENIYEIHADNLSLVTERLVKINKRADKLSVPHITVEVVESFIKEVGEDSYPMLKVVMHGETIKLAGWSFVATIQHTSEGNIVRAIPGSDVDTSEYRTVDAFCAHCETVRNRIDTYLVKHEDGTLKQVGSNCLIDFLGHDAKNALAHAQYLADFDDFMSEMSEPGEGGGGASVYKIEDYLSWVALSVRTNGWISRGAARYDDKTPTADMADLLRHDFYKKGRGEEPTISDYEKAEKAIAWAREIPENTNNDYLYNVRVACSHDYITHREFGLVASVIAAYNREVEKEIIAKREAITSEWVGEIKERRDFVLTVERVIYSEGAYGVTYITKLSDASGNVYTWFSSKELEQGKTYNIKATIKAHDEYQGVKQTIITRGKF